MGLIDLEADAEPELNIVKSIRPGMLAPQIAAYLSPRKREIYYFDAGAGGAGRPDGSRA